MTDPICFELEGHTIAALRVGGSTDGLPVIFLHGIGCSLYFWDEALARPFHGIGPCFSMSLPGHYPGRFPRGFRQVALTPELVGRLVAGAARQLVGPDPVLWVGHSTGGFAALCAAIFAPEQVAGVISIGGFALGRWGGPLALLQGAVRLGLPGRAFLKGFYRFGGASLKAYRVFWNSNAADPAALAAHPHFETLVLNTFPAVRSLDRNALAQYYSVMPRTDIGPLLERIRLPVLVLTGELDPIVPPQQAREIAAQVMGSTLAIVPGAGHLPFFERPEAYQRLLEGWLQKFQRWLPPSLIPSSKT